MTKFALTIACLIFTLPLSFGQNMARVEEVTIHSDILGQDRELLIYTPQFYDEKPYTPYDVIYVFDANPREIFDFNHSSISFISDH